jgi:hypothetical protein
VVLGDPEQGVGDKVITDLAAPVVEDERPPVGVPTLARVGVLVEVGTVEESEALEVLREVRRDPVDHHADPGPVKRVHQVLEVVGGTEPARRGEEAQRLVAPGAVEGVLGRRQELDVGVAHLGDVGDQFVGELPVGVVGAVGVPSPGAEVDLVDCHRGVEGVLLGATLHPGRITPLVAIHVVDHGGGAGEPLGPEAEGVGFEGHEITSRALDLVLVEGALAHVGDEYLPHPDPQVLAHDVPTSVPQVEISD